MSFTHCQMILSRLTGLCGPRIRTEISTRIRRSDSLYSLEPLAMGMPIIIIVRDLLMTDYHVASSRKHTWLHDPRIWNPTLDTLINITIPHGVSSN
jgi:hypothetical protein